MLTIAGQNIPITEFAETWDRVGDEGRAFDGGAWSQVRVEKRVWRATSSYLTAAEVTTLRAATTLDAIVAATNTLDGVTISAMVRVGEVSDFRPVAGGTLRRVSLELREV